MDCINLILRTFATNQKRYATGRRQQNETISHIYWPIDIYLGFVLELNATIWLHLNNRELLKITI